MEPIRLPPKSGRIVRTIATAAGFTVVVVLLLMWLAGAFSAKIDATRAHAAAAVAGGRPVGDTPLVAARVLRTPRIETAVGTIQAVHEAAVAAKLLAKVLAVNVQAGQQVKTDEVLVRLDDADLRAQLKQADAGVAAAQATRDHAQTEFDRVRQLYEQHNAAKTEYDAADTALKSATAELERATQTREQARTVLDYATVRSPIDGVVIDKKVEAGDTAQPGQVLLTLYDPTRMQLIASVRESLTQRLKVGQPISVCIDALNKVCDDARISEIVPQAQSASRTFAVKVTGPCPPGVYSGMFGRLLIPLDEEQVLVIPQAAVRRVGQLDMVDVAEPPGGDGGTGGPSAGALVLRRRVVQLGREFGDDVQVLSGLRAGEQVATPRGAPATTGPAAASTP